MKKLTLAAGAAVLAMGATALFAAPGDMGSRMGAKLDADANGSVTRAEAQIAADAGWTRLDANKDGKLDPADRTARHAARFDRIDADNNGAINEAEFVAAHEARMEKREMIGERKGGGHKGHRMGGRSGMGMLATADANGDKAVTQAEFRKAAESRFAKADTNNDGSISAEERKAQRPGKWTPRPVAPSDAG